MNRPYKVSAVAMFLTFIFFLSPFSFFLSAEEPMKENPKPGAPAPDASAMDETGQPVKLSSFKDKQGIVLFFFPKADTPG